MTAKKKDIKQFTTKEVTLKYIEIYNNIIKLYFYDKNHYQNLTPIDKIIKKESNNNWFYIKYFNVTHIKNNNFKIKSNYISSIQSVINTIKKLINRKRTLIKNRLTEHPLLTPFIIINKYHKQLINEESKKKIITNWNINIGKLSISIGDPAKVYISKDNPLDYQIDINCTQK